MDVSAAVTNLALAVEALVAVRTTLAGRGLTGHFTDALDTAIARIADATDALAEPGPLDDPQPE